MAKTDTLPEILRPLMRGTSMMLNHCAICGRTYPLNNHHIVRRGAGKMYRCGVEIPKPTITLCGSGNTSGCHGLAHQNRLHFRWVEEKQPDAQYCVPVIPAGHWEYIICDEPTKYGDALEMKGWKKLRSHE